MPAKQTSILVADDDPQLLHLVARNLELEGYAVVRASDGQQALEQMQVQSLDLLLLDVMMPKVDGFSVCQRVRTFSAIPIIILTAQGRDADKVHGLELGADDYLGKPFSIDELLARIRAVLRRSRFTANEGSNGFLPATKIGEITLDYVGHQVTKAGQPIALSPIEFHILTYLAQNAGRVIPQDDLLEHIWGSEYVGEAHIVQVNIARLRHKLETDPAHPHYILTKPGVGYLLALHPGFEESKQENSLANLIG
jgi:DNA-binding response OmpR family regulator